MTKNFYPRLVGRRRKSVRTCQPWGLGNISFHAHVLGSFALFLFCHSIQNQPSSSATSGPGLEKSYMVHIGSHSQAFISLSGCPSLNTRLLQVWTTSTLPCSHMYMHTSHLCSLAGLLYQILLKAIITWHLTSDLPSNICTHFIMIIEHYIESKASLCPPVKNWKSDKTSWNTDPCLC